MKINKKMMLNYLALLLVLAGSASCDKELSDVRGDWVCSPEPDANATITLTFISGKTYVSTSPQDINSVTEKRVLFYDDTQYIVRGDTLYYNDPNPNASPANYGFVGTINSSNSMKLQSFGVQFPANATYITNYIFERKTN